MATKRMAEATWVESKGLWRIQIQRDGVKKEFTTTTPGRKGKHLVEAKADQWLASGTDDMRFPEAWKQFMKFHTKNVRSTTSEQYDSTYNNHIMPVIKSRKLSTITPIVWQHVLNSAADKGLSAYSIRNIRVCIMVFYRFCRLNRWTVQTIEQGDLVVPKYAPSPKKRKSLAPDLIRELFEHPEIMYYGKVQLSPYSYALPFAVATGLRRGELAGLKFSDIDGNILHVNRAINRLQDINTGKTQNAQRTIELSTAALDILNKQRAFLRSRGIVSPWVFAGKHGELPNPKIMYTHWKVWASMHNADLCMHELRHTFISVNRCDMPVELMKSVVGHSANMDTFGTYGHTVEGDLHRAAEITSVVFERILNNTGN